RVDARRLRDRLREYYASTPDSGVVISVTKGGYTPVFHGTATATDIAPAPWSIPPNPHGVGDADVAAMPGPEVQVPAATEERVRRRWWIGGAALVLIGAVGWGVTRLRSNDSSELMRLLTVTSLPGAEENPSLSPDGNFVAFSWAGAAPDASPDIWIKPVEGDALRNLTNTPEVTEKYPQWSPD